MDFVKASKLARKHGASTGLTLMKQKKHVTISWHMMGTGRRGLTGIFENSLGKYRRELEGVPVALGNIETNKMNILIVFDHSCAHIDVVADLVVFKPKIGAIYYGQIAKLDKTTVTCKLHDLITIMAKRTEQNNDCYQIGNSLAIKVQTVVVNKNMCQLKGTIAESEQMMKLTEAYSSKKKRKMNIDKQQSDRSMIDIKIEVEDE